jgi:phosphate acetyltransferase
MARNLYIATTEARSGKSLIVLGVMELLSHRIENIGFFRPVIRAGDIPDNDIELVRTRYHLPLPYDSLYGVTHDQARQMSADGQHDRLLKRIYGRYKEVERQCDFVLCEGTDFTGVSSAFEFEFNGQVANHLGAPVVMVASGRGKTVDELIGVVRAAREAFDEEGCSVAATMVNRVVADDADRFSVQIGRVWPHPDPVYVLPEAEILDKPTVGEVAAAVGAQLLHGDGPGIHREVLDRKVAAMHVPNFLTHVEQGSLILTPGDRADMLLSCLAIAYSDSYPQIAGVLLTGGLKPDPHVMRLIEGLKQSNVPIYLTATDTYATATRVESVHATLTPQNDRKIATALGVFEARVDGAALAERIQVARTTRVTPIMFEYELIERAKANRQHIVLPEGSDERIVRASDILLQRGVVDVTLLGQEQAIRHHAAALGANLDGANFIDPAESEWRDEFAKVYLDLRRHKGVTADVAHDVVLDVSYFGTLMVHRGYADAMVSGATHTTAHTIRPAFQIIKTRPDCLIVSSVFFMCLEDRVLVYGDCAINLDPNPEQLADIAINSAATAEMFGVEPRVALLSYSTGASGKGADVDKVRAATRIAQQRRGDLPIDGPMQYDAAVDPGVAKKKMPDSHVAGRATVLIFPDLNAGNNTYKAVQRSAGAVAVGPVLQGLKKPVNDLSRGCTVTDIVNTVAITAIQAGVGAGNRA